LRLLRTHALGDQLLGALFNMQAYLFGKIVVESPAAKDSRNPIHGETLLAGSGLAWIEY